MANALPRAHVGNLNPVVASGEDIDIDIETLRATEDNDQKEVEAAPRLSRKEKSRTKKERRLDDNRVLASLDDTNPFPTPDDSEASTDTSQPQSRKHRRKAKKQAPISTPSKSITPLSATSPSPSLPRTLPPTTMPPTPHPLLICSLGNPGPQYAHTLHSTGHTILTTLQSHANYRPFVPGLSGLIARPDTTSRTLSWTGLITKQNQNRELLPHEDDFTLWQSTTLMNISGANVKKAWNKYAADQRARGVEGRLVVVHDELEAELGKISVKMGSASPRGHNGLKSVQAALGSGVRWWRVGVGIGRPESREASVVSKYVLRKMTAREEVVMERAAAGVQKVLRDIAEEKY